MLEFQGLWGIENLKNIEVIKEYREKIVQALDVNKIIHDYYDRLGDKKYSEMKEYAEKQDDKKFNIICKNYNDAVEKLKGLSYEKKELYKSRFRVDFDKRLKVIDKDIKKYRKIKKDNTLEFHKLYQKGNTIDTCNNYWHIDYYNVFDIKNIISQFFCKDIFCPVCKKVLQAQRMKKYMPVLQKYDKDLYFVTLTVPNSSYNDYKDTLKCIEMAYSELNKVLSRKRSVGETKRIKELGYKGSLCSYETTYYNSNNKRHRGKEMHPHLHCAFILTGANGRGYKMPKANCGNKYSVKQGQEESRLFTSHEIFIQKLWYLLYLEAWIKKETKSDENLEITSVDVFTLRKDQITDKVSIIFKVGILRGEVKSFENKGLSCTIDKFRPGQYREMFKYMVKDKAQYEIDDSSDIKPVINDKERVMDFKVFETLYNGLHGFKQLRPFGLFVTETKKDKSDDNVIDDKLIEENVKIYEDFINWLKLKNAPVRVCETPQETLKSDSLYINTKKIYSFVMKTLLEDKFKDVQYKASDNMIAYPDFVGYMKISEEIPNISKSDTVLIQLWHKYNSECKNTDVLFKDRVTIV